MMKNIKNTIKKIFILNLIFCLIFSHNTFAITEEIDWAPGRSKAKNAKPATNNGNDKNGLQTYFYVPRTGQWESTNSTSGCMMLHMAFNEVGKQKGAYGTWTFSGNHIRCGDWYGTNPSDEEQPHGFINYFGMENGEPPEHLETLVSFIYNSTYENPEVICNNNFKCGSSESCQSTTCTASINITIDPSPIGENYSEGDIIYKGLVDNTHMNWEPGVGAWCEADGIYTCPEQNGSINISDNKKWQNSESYNINGGEIFAPITTTMKPFTVWNSGTVYGMDEQDQSMTSGDNVQALYNNVSLSVAQFDLGNYLWPYFKMKYVDWTSPTKWSDIYCIGAPSRLTNPLIVYTATNVGGNTSDKKFTLDIDSQWDGWTQTMEGLDRTGILDANGGDKNVVVNGGSTVFIKAFDTSNNADTLKFAVTGFIPLYSYKDLSRIPNSSSEKDARSVWCYCGCDDDSGSDTWGEQQCQQYPFTGIAAYHCAQQMEGEIEKNLGHARIQLMAAEGIYRQGEEHLFEQVAQCVKGANENDTEKIIGGSKAKGAQGSFGSFNGTAGVGKGNKLDSKHEKYNLVNKYSDVEEHNDSIKLVSTGRPYYRFYQAWIDTRKDNEAILNIWDYDDPNKLVGDTWDECLLNISTSYKKQINIRNELKDKQTGKGQDIDELFANVINSLPDERWKQMERMSGWLTNHLSCLDFGCGGDNLRPSDKSYLDSAGHGQTKGWYNEGITDFGLLEFQFEYELSFDGSTKWLVMDPALCGQAVDQWDLKNWTDGNNDGKKDDDLTKPGALKNKVRTLRFQMSDFFKYNDDEEIDPRTGLAYWSADSPLYQRTINSIMASDNEQEKEKIKKLFNAGRGDTEYVATLCVIDIDGSTSEHYGTGDYLDTLSDYPHWLSVPVYLNFNTALKSKFFYMDNSTVQDNYN